MKSILQQEYDLGYKQGEAQAGMLHYDDAYQKGADAARAQSPSRRKWFCIGFAVASLYAYLLTVLL